MNGRERATCRRDWRPQEEGNYHDPHLSAVLAFYSAASFIPLVDNAIKERIKGPPPARRRPNRAAVARAVSADRQRKRLKRVSVSPSPCSLWGPVQLRAAKPPTDCQQNSICSRPCGCLRRPFRRIRPPTTHPERVAK